jgi:hypothetical protein
LIFRLCFTAYALRFEHPDHCADNFPGFTFGSSTSASW